MHTDLAHGGRMPAFTALGTPIAPGSGATPVFFDLAHLAATPWKNGGGNTREIACWPTGADMDHFGWRVSVATIASAGPFSIFAGVHRQMLLLSGGGVQLHSESAGWQHRLDQHWQPFVFSGDDLVECELLGEASTDFNLMLRASAWRGDLQVVHSARRLVGSPAGLCMALQGTWDWVAPGAPARRLVAGQGVWWASRETDFGDAGASQAACGLIPHGLDAQVAPRQGSDATASAAAPHMVWIDLQRVGVGN